MKGESTSMLNSAQHKWLIIYHSSKIDIWKNNLRCESFAMSFKKHNYIFFQNKIRPGKDHWQWVFNTAGSYIFPWSLMRSQAMMIMMTVVMNYFWRMVDQQKAITLYCQIFSTLQISDMWWAGFEPAQNLSSELLEWNWMIVIPLPHSTTQWFSKRSPCVSDILPSWPYRNYCLESFIDEIGLFDVEHMFNKAETISKEPCLSLDNSAEQQVVNHKWPAILGLRKIKL